MSALEYESFDALGLAELVVRGEVSPVELVEAAIERIERYNPRLNAVIHKLYDRARESASGELGSGPFRGVPFLLKDILAAYEGAPLSAGSRFYDGFVAQQNSRVVDRFLASGVVVVGKTNLPELALMPVTEPERFGPTRNPYDLALTSGGSSGGSAAAVASRMVPMASGGDGGGSIRMPSSCCGVFGLKPTRGRVPTGPTEGELWQGYAAEHVITRSVRDSAAMLDAIAGGAPGELYVAPPPQRPFLAEVSADPGRMRIGFSTASPLSDTIHADCIRAVRDTVSLLQELGHELVEYDLDLDGDAWLRTNLIMMSGVTAGDVRDAQTRMGKKARLGDFERGTWIARAVGESVSAGQFVEALRAQQRMSMGVAEQLSQFDAWLTPTLGKPPLQIGELQAQGAEAQVEALIARLQLGGLALRSGALNEFLARVFDFMPFTMLANGPGLPSMSVPLHENARGVPIGVMFTSRFGDEATLYRLAGQLETARPWNDKRPELVDSPGSVAQALGAGAG